MWCRHCQQEVPVQGSARSVGARCPRCERLLGAKSESIGLVDSAVPPEAEPSRQAAINHSLRLAKARLAAGEPATTLRYDLAQHGVSPALSPGSSEEQRRTERLVAQQPSQKRTSRSGQVFAWIMAACGATTLGCGIGLLAWTLWGNQPELWNIALAATLAGQGLLILALLQLVAVLWSAGRGAAQRLRQVHEELRSLRRVTDTVAGRHSATASQYYAELAQNAAPDLLLGNLRGQLDALSARLRD